MLFGVTRFDAQRHQPPGKIDVATVVVAAATNACLLRRRHHNAYNPKTSVSSLQHDTQRTIESILLLVRKTATAMRTLARKEEDRIYTHFEGWLPAEEEQPTEEWRTHWCSRGLLKDTQPRASLNFTLPLTAPHAAPDPTYDASSALQRLRQHA